MNALIAVLLVVGGLFALLGTGFAMSGSVWSFGLGLIGLGLYCGITALVVQTRKS